MRSSILLFLAAQQRRQYHYLPKRSFVLSSTNLPTIDELKSKPFIDQVGFAAEIVPLLETTKEQDDIDDDLLADMIAAQLSHSDGIRGFFVSYLAGSPDDTDKETVVPKPLQNAMKKVENQKDLISLACMNLIMPTAMVTMHTDEEMAKSSAMTAARGKMVASVLMDSDEMRQQSLAIIAAATGNTEGCKEKDVKYWKDFYAKWGYGEKQLEDVTTAFDSLTSS